MRNKREPPDDLFHRLWTKAVGTPDYDKEEWKALEKLIWEDPAYKRQLERNSKVMRDPDRIKRILSLLEKEWESMPDLRLGQLMVNIIELELANPGVVDIFYIEDDTFENILTKLYKPRQRKGHKNED